MTDSLELTELADTHVDADGVRRDYLDRYMCRPPGELKLVPHRRMTTVLKALDSEGGLLTWSQSRAVLGAIRDPALWRKARKLTRVGALDAWYSSPGDKAAFKALLSELADAGGRHARADLGTYLHGVAERFIRDGEAPADPAALAWLDNYVTALNRAGIEIDPNYLEVIVVRDGERIAGKVDYLRVLVPGYELPLIGDLKTGDTLDYAINGYGIQLAGYRFADNIYVQGAADDGSDDERLAMPELDEHVGLIIHAPAGAGPVTFHLVDLDAGRHGLELALGVEAWRKRTDVATELDNGELLAQLRASLALTKVGGLINMSQQFVDALPQPPPVLTVVPDVPDSAPEAERPPQPQGEATAEQLRPWLQERIDTIGRHELARADLVRLWPAGLPTLKTYADHSSEQLAQIERLCDAIEARRSLPFGPNRPKAEAAALRWITTAFPGSTVEAEPPDTKHQGATS